MVARSYKTAKGTELPLLNLKGKQYLEVKYRLVWFREEHPDWSIETELMNVTDVSTYARASVRDEKGRIIATSHKFESIQGFPDFIEKAETGAIGRALALIGYGTQFCADELDEGKRIVDSPVKAKGQASSEEAAANPAPREEAETETEEESEDEAVGFDPGNYMISFGRKYKGKKLRDVPKNEIEGYLQWLEQNALREGTPLSYQARLLKNAFEKFYSAKGAEDAAASH